MHLGALTWIPTRRFDPKSLWTETAEEKGSVVDGGKGRAESNVRSLRVEE